MAAYRLFRAERVLEKGACPSDLLKALGFPEAARDLAKYISISRAFQMAAAAKAGTGLHAMD